MVGGPDARCASPDLPRTRFLTTVRAPTVDLRPSRVFVKSFGCQMNVYDSAGIAALLSPDGAMVAAKSDDADIVVLNTCDIRERASEKVFSELGNLRAWKQARREAGREPVLVVAGCVAQAQGAEVMRRQPDVDIVVGPQAYQALPALVRAARAGTRAVATDFAAAQKFDQLLALAQRPTKPRAVSAFLTVQEGCDKFCTFCVVPYTRGGEVCRAPDSILAEAQALIAGGTRELVLLGQNVNAYRYGNADFAALIASLSALDGLARIRYTTSHPRDVTDALIAAHRDNPKLMPFLHLPVQSGSDRILRAMNRRHDVDHYRRVIDRLRASRADMAFSTDIIVGFPGESDSDFEATCTLVRDTGYAGAYTFKYSVRPGTPAADMDDQVDEHLKHARLLHLQALVEDGRRAHAASLVRRVAPVLFEKAGRNAGQIIGRTPWFGSVYVEGPVDLVGHIRDVRLDAAGPNSHAGSLVASEGVGS